MRKIILVSVVLAISYIAAAGRAAVININGLEVAFNRQGAVTLNDPGDYDWWYGCSPTSAGMIMGHYDVNGYGGASYDNLVPGGSAEDSTHGSGPYIVNSIIASQGHQYDFYGNVNGSPDRSTFVYDTGGGYGYGFGYSGEDIQQPTHSLDCLADFMGTSQDAYSNSNGSTTFWNYTDGRRLHDYEIFSAGPSYYQDSGMYGIHEYLEYAGYEIDSLFNQYILGHNGNTQGFTFDDYITEIDAGRPVMIHVAGHSMYGYGYDQATNEVLLHDTWSLGEHRMIWGNSYSGMDHYGVTALELVIPEPITMVLLSVGALLVLKRRSCNN